MGTLKPNRLGREHVEQLANAGALDTRSLAPSGDTTLEVCELQPLAAAVPRMDYVPRWCLHVKLVVGEEVESDRTIVKCADARCQELGECYGFHGGDGRRFGARDTVPLIDVLYRHVECLRMEGLASGEDALWLRPQWNFVGLGDLLDTIAAVSLLVVEGGTLWAGIHDCSTA